MNGNEVPADVAEKSSLRAEDTASTVPAVTSLIIANNCMQDIAAKASKNDRMSENGRTSPQRFYLPELDALRFFAFLAVFVCHAFSDAASKCTENGAPSWAASLVGSVVHAGGFGVDLFFLLSSFLITSLLLREQKSTGKVDLRGFWIRRCLRIWPLYFTFVGIAGFLLPTLFHFIAPVEKHHIVGLFTFTQNWAIAFSDAGRGSPTLLLWSVSMEEQFYFLWPIAIAMAGVKRIRSIAIGMIIASLLARIYAIQSGASWFMLWCATPLRMEPLAAGALIALASDRTPAFGTKARTGMLVLGLSIPIACISPWTESQWKNAAVFPLVTLGCALIFLAIRGTNWRLFKSKPLIYLGKISYGLYVFHQLAISFSPRVAIPGISFGKAIGAFRLTIALASLSYRFLERPFLLMKDRFARIPSRPA